MASHVVIPIIVIIVVIIALIVTGYIADPLVDIPSLALIGFLTYRMVYVIVKTRHRNFYSYTGKVGKAVDDLAPNKPGYVLIEGEYWQAVSNEPISAGEPVIVVGKQGFILVVKKANRDEVVV
ncbi:MAG: NfeD family protein [Candidatus Aramenus sp.]|nr:NfeD family protein [Candidatus Aramenus sp.]